MREDFIVKGAGMDFLSLICGIFFFYYYYLACSLLILFLFFFGFGFFGIHITFEVTLSVYFWEGNFIMGGHVRARVKDILSFTVWNRITFLYLLNLISKTPKNSIAKPIVSLRLITTSTSTTSTMHTFYNRTFCQLCLWNTTNTSGFKVRFFSLNAFQTTKFLVSLFLPSCD